MKILIITILSLGFMILGIGCISLAIFTIGAPYNFSYNPTPSPYSIHTPSVVETNKLTGISTYPLESVLSLGLLTLHKTLYPEYPTEGDYIGSLMIPALNRTLPILQGTGVNELKKGVGHFIQSVLPGEEDNCVFSGHRDTVFIQIGNLKVGDQVIVQTSAGTFTYEANATRIVHEDDKTVIVPTDHAVLTMTTCYPFYAIGNSPDRYIISATLIKVNKPLNPIKSK